MDNIKSSNTTSSSLSSTSPVQNSNMQKYWKSSLIYLQKSIQFAWLELRTIKWKNEKPPYGTSYTPVQVEHIANIITHGMWIIPAIFAALQLANRSKNYTQYVSAWVYGTTLTLLMLISTFFHTVFYFNKNRKLRNILHRCDRSMIYIFIAGSYFPWLQLAQMAHPTIIRFVHWCVWCLATLGITYQQIYHERYKSLETILYVVMGLGPSLIVVMYGFDFQGMSELKLGGFLYILGICFFKADGIIPCAHAIWHLFVVLAASVHYYAISNYLFPSN